MRRTTAVIGTTIFFVFAPCVVAGVVPWWISRWEFRLSFFSVEFTRFVGAVLILAGVAGLVDSFGRFALQGLGTPAPIAPTQNLVVTGLYRYVRNPIYVAVAAVIFGQAVLFGDWRLLAYGAVFCLVCHLFVVGYEEPTLPRSGISGSNHRPRRITAVVTFARWRGHVPRRTIDRSNRGSRTAASMLPTVSQSSLRSEVCGEDVCVDRGIGDDLAAEAARNPLRPLRRQRQLHVMHPVFPRRPVALIAPRLIIGFGAGGRQDLPRRRERRAGFIERLGDAKYSPGAVPG